MTLTSLAAVESYRLEVESYWVDTSHTTSLLKITRRVRGFFSLLYPTIQAAAQLLFSGSVTCFLDKLIIIKQDKEAFKLNNGAKVQILGKHDVQKYARGKLRAQMCLLEISTGSVVLTSSSFSELCAAE